MQHHSPEVLIRSLKLTRSLARCQGQRPGRQLQAAWLPPHQLLALGLLLRRSNLDTKALGVLLRCSNMLATKAQTLA